jgi:hypothetical protein
MEPTNNKDRPGRGPHAVAFRTRFFLMKRLSRCCSGCFKICFGLVSRKELAHDEGTKDRPNPDLLNELTTSVTSSGNV